MKPHYVVPAALALAACSNEPAGDSGSAEEDAFEAQLVSVMAFNVENLFDEFDDPGKNDSTYLPLAAKADPAHVDACNAIEVERWRNDCLYLDWNADAVDFKLEQLAATIRQYNDGFGPDVIAFQEVENARILNRLSHEHLGDAGYGDAILIEGSDLRGIDVAFLSRLPVVAGPTLHPLDMSEFPDRAGDTRGVLEATFELPDGGRLTGFSVHFPAPFHPIEMRWIAYEHLNALRERVPGDHQVFAAGDFNTPKREMEGTTIMDEMVRPYWTVAHEIGCDGCKGTNYWARGDTWSFLDMILYSPAESGTSEWRLVPGSVEVLDGYADQLRADGTPKRFDLERREGVSDHLPILMTLEAVDSATR